MQVNNVPRNDHIQSDTSHTKADQPPADSEDAASNKPVIHPKEKKQIFPEEASDEAHAKALSPDAQKQAMNRFNNINHHFNLMDALGEDRLDPHSDSIPSPDKKEANTGAKIAGAATPPTKDSPVKNEKPSELESAARAAIESEENKKFQQYLGIRSPEAEKAMAQLNIEKNNSSNYDLDEIEENIITKNQILEITPSGTPRPLEKIQAQELGDAVFGKKCFRVQKTCLRPTGIYGH